MSRVTVTPALETFLRSLASSVVVAAITPAAVNGDWAIRTAITVAVVVMVISRQAWLAMLAGMAAAGLFRYVIGA